MLILLGWNSFFNRSIVYLLFRWVKSFQKSGSSFSQKEQIYQGWSHSEKKFRWSLNKSSIIYFKINPNDLIGKLKLNINTLGKQNIKLNINGYHLGEKTANGENKQLKFTFDPTILKKNKINIIKFEFPNAHTANSKDKRMLAMALKSFILE